MIWQMSNFNPILRYLRSSTYLLLVLFFVLEKFHFIGEFGFRFSTSLYFFIATQAIYRFFLNT